MKRLITYFVIISLLVCSLSFTKFRHSVYASGTGNTYLAEFEKPKYTANNYIVGVDRWKALLSFTSPSVRDNNYCLQNGLQTISGEQHAVYKGLSGDSFGAYYSLEDYFGNLGNGFRYKSLIRPYEGCFFTYGLWTGSNQGTPLFIRLLQNTDGNYFIQAFITNSNNQIEIVDTGITFNPGELLGVTTGVDLVNKEYIIEVYNFSNKTTYERKYKLAITSLTASQLTDGISGILAYGMNAGLDNVKMLETGIIPAIQHLLIEFEQPGYTANNSIVGVSKWETLLTFNSPIVRDNVYCQQNGLQSIMGEQSVVFKSPLGDSFGVYYSMEDYDGRLGNGFKFNTLIRPYEDCNFTYGLWTGSNQGTPLFLRLLKNAAGSYIIQAFITNSSAQIEIVDTGICFNSGDLLEITTGVDLISKEYIVEVYNYNKNEMIERRYKLAITSLTASQLTDGISGIMIYGINAGIDNLKVLEVGKLPSGEPVKKSSVLYPNSFITTAISNAQNYDWAEEIKNNRIAEAEFWRNMTDDELWSLMIPHTLSPRSLMVWSDGYCPQCSESVQMYSWLIDAEMNPWKVKCPHCSTLFPTNDFQAFYNSGIDAITGLYDPTRADRNLLYNAQHPDPGDPLHMFGVDDGTGFSQDGNTWYFIGTYQYWGQWYDNVLNGIKNLASAYVVTGDDVYAHKAAILLDRVADLFPYFDYLSQGLVYEIHQVPGYISYRVDSAYDVRYLAEAYDQIFDSIKTDSTLVDFLSSKALKYSRAIENPKTSFKLIQKNIEERIFKDALNHTADKIYTNYPNTPITEAIVKTVIGWPDSRSEVYDIINTIVANSTAVDGLTGEKGLANYSASSIQNLAMMLAKYSRIDTNFLPNLLNNYPEIYDSFKFFADTWCLNGYYPHSGDSGWFAQRISQYKGVAFYKPGRIEYITLAPSMYSFLWQMYQLTSDPMFAQVMYLDNSNTTQGLPYDIFSSDPAGVQQGVANIIQQNGSELKRGSSNKQDWHIAVMRSDRNDFTNTFWIDYDSGKDHGHYDGMNLGLYAKGLDLMTDFGYPPVNLDGWQGQYTAWYKSTLSHNTVVVNGQNQPDNVCGSTTLWADGDKFHAIRVSAPALNNGNKYERTIAMNDINNDDTYLVDVFRVKGETEHTRFMSSQFGTITTQGLNLVPASNIWNGALLQNVKKDSAPIIGWSVDWQIEDYYNYLPDGSDIHLKYTDLTTGAEAYIADAWIQIDYNSGIQRWIPRIATKRTGTGLFESTFVGVIEPYENSPNINSIKRLELEDEYGNILSDSFVAIEINLSNGNSDIVLMVDPETYIQGGKIKQSNWNIEMVAELCIIRKDAQGNIKRVAFSKGTSVKFNGVTYNMPVGSEYYEQEF